jgi:hypothetical protein
MFEPNRKMSGRHNKSHLVGRVASAISAKMTDLSNNKVKSDLSFNADVSGWINTINQTLNDKLLAAADAGRSFHIVESPIFINPGKLASGDISFNGVDIKFEYSFRAYLKAQYDPLTRFHVDSSIVVTEILPPRPPVAGTPKLPQNVMFRYRFSW